MRNPNSTGGRAHPTRRRWTALGAGLLLATGRLGGAQPASATDAAPAPVTVTVNARAGLATVPDTALGVTPERRTAAGVSRAAAHPPPDGPGRGG